MAKEKKTQDELAEMLMKEIRKHPECSHVENVALIQSAQNAPHDPNWNAAWTVDGNKSACAEAFGIANELRGKIDVIW